MITTQLEYTCSLEEALDCENQHEVIEGFMNRYNVSQTEAEEIFEETKKWLWLAAKSEESGLSLSIDKPLLVIDEMWHNFILYTKYYQNYCLNKFNKFIHHLPTSKSTKEAHQIKMDENPTIEINKWEKAYHKQLSYIYDELGAETVMKWYEEFPTKYNTSYLNTIKK